MTTQSKRKEVLIFFSSLFILLIFLFYLTTRSRIAADDYCNSYQVANTDFYALLLSWISSAPFLTYINFTYINFSVVNNLEAEFSSIFITTTYSLLFLLMAILINLIFRLKFQLHFINSFIIVMFLILVTLSLGTDAGGYFYTISWAAASANHLLPSILILISILLTIGFAQNSFTSNASIRFIAISFYFFLTILIANSHFFWSTTFFITQLILMYKFLYIQKTSSITKILMSSQLILLLHLIFIFFLQINSQRYKDVGGDFSNVNSFFNIFINNLISNFWILINSYSILLSICLGILFSKFYKIKNDNILFFGNSFLYHILVFFLASLIMVSFGEVIAYSAPWHLLGSAFGLNLFLFIVTWSLAPRLENLIKSNLVFLLPVTALFIAAYLISDRVTDRLTKWNNAEPAPYGVMTDLDSDWVVSCSNRLNLPINKRGFDN